MKPDSNLPTLKVLAAGLLGMGGFAALAFVVFPRSVVTTAFLMPGVPFVPLVGAVIPDSLVYRLAPEGGPLMALLISLPSAAIVWTLVSAFAWHSFRTWRHPAGRLSDESHK